MCKWDTTRQIVIQRKITVDACIADEILFLNNNEVYTVNSCCGHFQEKPKALIENSSAKNAKMLGYEPIYRDDIGLHEIELKGDKFNARINN